MIVRSCSTTDNAILCEVSQRKLFFVRVQRLHWGSSGRVLHPCSSSGACALLFERTIRPIFNSHQVQYTVRGSSSRAQCPAWWSSFKVLRPTRGKSALWETRLSTFFMHTNRTLDLSIDTKFSRLKSRDTVPLNPAWCASHTYRYYGHWLLIFLPSSPLLRNSNTGIYMYRQDYLSW